VFDDAWLAQVSEEILDPDLAICDPHHHLWWRPENKYLLDDLLKDTGSGHRVVSTVFVECSSMYRDGESVACAPVGETEFVQGVAAMSASGGFGETRVAKGIVSFADLTLGLGVREVLEAHQQAGVGRFRGIRHAAGWHESSAIRNSHANPVQGLMMRNDFREGMSVLDDMGLSFDAWFYHHQFAEFADLARAFPNVTMILDHFGGPLGIGPYANNRDHVFEDWKQSIGALVDCKNVYFKLGGINMKLNGFEWHKRDKPPSSDELVDATAPYYDHCIDLFGVDRCMFESNFPVDKESCSYAVLWNAFKKMTAGRSAPERQALFHDNAHRAYRLGQ
tara:strand:+ start:92 stop:1096 length:1005 start_codon:yes stop_codon:yes gene_type:complete